MNTIGRKILMGSLTYLKLSDTEAVKEFGNFVAIARPATRKSSENSTEEQELKDSTVSEDAPAIDPEEEIDRQWYLRTQAQRSHQGRGKQP
jgi:hypothetical protein